jgi:hypothetical protein
MLPHRLLAVVHIDNMITNQKTFGLKKIWHDGTVVDCETVSELAVGTSLQGEINCAYSVLVAAFGEPENNYGSKTQVQWTVLTPDGIATIYDWKQGDSYLGKGQGLYPEEITQWSIGGMSRWVLESIKECIKNATSNEALRQNR